MKIKVLFIVIINSYLLIAQSSIFNYKIGNEISDLSKEQFQNPLSNSITDIITIGDTIWLGTSRGVSLSTDNGLNWTNFYGQSDFGTDNVSAIAYNNGVFWCATARSNVVTGGITLL